MAQRFPHRRAVVVDGNEAITFAQWERRSNALARGLVDQGIRPGDRVAILLANSDAILCYVTYMAIQKAGGVAAPINPRLARTEIAHILANARPSAIVAAGEHLSKARDASLDLEPRPWLIGPVDSHDTDGHRVPIDRALEDLEAFDTDTFQVPISESDLADLLYTSGTTGLPKGVASTHQNVLSINVLASEVEDAFMHAAPLGTVLGTYGTMIACLRLGLTNVCLPVFSTSRFAELINDQRPGWLMLVPAHVHLLRESGALNGVDTTSVKVVLFGSAPMPSESFAWLAATFIQALVMNAYSLTEAGDAACLLSFEDARTRPSSVGKPMAGGAVDVIDEDGNHLAVNQIGELVLRMRSGSRFYFDNPDATAQTFHDGWVHTGDLGYVDGDGFVYLVDRKHDVINRGGFNVYSVEVENALYEHPAVLEAAVLGVVHPILGQDVAAVVRLAEGTSLDVAGLRTFLTDRLADFKQPRQLFFFDTPLPRTSLEKIDKSALRVALSLNDARIA
jgi:acyl-CoA synthetase (AMP-forming)/AMP-acid ligase II